MPNEIEPDGQQFLDARGEEDRREGDQVGDVAPLETKRSLALPIAAVIGGLAVVAFIAGYFVLFSDDGDPDLTDVATRGDLEVSERGNEVVTTTTTTTEPEETTTTSPPTTAAPTTTRPPPPTSASVPQTVVIQSQPGGVPGQPNVVVTCPGGSVATQMSGSFNENGTLTASGTATSYFSTPVRVTLNLTLSNGGQRTADLSPNPIPANGSANWEFEGQVADNVTVTNLTGSFTFVAPEYSHCAPGSIG